MTYAHMQPRVAAPLAPTALLYQCATARIASERFARDCDSNQGVNSPSTCVSVPSSPPHVTAPASEQASSLAGATVFVAASAVALTRSWHGSKKAGAFQRLSIYRQATHRFKPVRRRLSRAGQAPHNRSRSGAIATSLGASIAGGRPAPNLRFVEVGA